MIAFLTLKPGVIGVWSSIASISSTVVLLVVYLRAYQDTRTSVKIHLDVMERWLEGPQRGRRGWTVDQVTVDHVIQWLDPAGTIFPLVSGPALVQISTAETLLLGKDLTRQVITLNQSIEAFNATLDKVESFRVSHTKMLTLAHREAARRRHSLPAAIDPARPGALLEALELDTGDRDIATTLIRLSLGLHVDRIGAEEGEGLCGENTRTRRMLKYPVHHAPSAARLDETGGQPVKRRQVNPRDAASAGAR